MSVWSRSAGAVAVVLAGCSPALAFHPFAHWHHHKQNRSGGMSAGFSTTTTTFVSGTGFVAGGRSGGFVAPGGFTTGFAAPTGFVTGFSAPTGFVNSGFGNATGFVNSGFGTGNGSGFVVFPSGFVANAGNATGFNTDAGFLGSGIGVDIARRVLCSGSSSGGGSGSGSSESAEILREIREELKAIKSKIGTTPATTPAVDGGTIITAPTIPGGGGGIPAGFGFPDQGQPLSFRVAPLNPQGFNLATPLARAGAYTELADRAASQALVELEQATKGMATDASAQPVKDRLKELRKKLEGIR